MVIALGVRMKGEGPQGQRGGERRGEGASGRAGGQAGERAEWKEGQSERERPSDISGEEEKDCRGQRTARTAKQQEGSALPRLHYADTHSYNMVSLKS